MSDLKAQGGELRATVTITRKATGKTETFEIVGHSDPDKLPELLERVRLEQSAITGEKHT